MTRHTPWNPDPKAVGRVSNPLSPPEYCPHCGFTVLILHHEDVYGDVYSDWPWMYQCRGCRAQVGMHPFTNIPVGTLADVETRKARRAAKPVFESLHKTGLMQRSEAYKALAARLGIPRNECHFGWFDKAMCERARLAAEELYEEAMKQSRREP